jgi:hypothetical protein
MNLGQIRQFIKYQLSTLNNGSGSDPFLTDTIIDSFINRGIKWVEDQHFWVETQRAMKRDSEANKEDYTIPEKFKARSIKQIQYNSKAYSKTEWSDYLLIKEDYGDDGYTKPVFGVYGDKYFLNPMPKADGVKDILVWGQTISSDLASDSDTHLFNRTPNLENAVIEYALHLCYRKKRGQFKQDSVNALNIAQSLVDREWEEQKRQRADEKSEMVAMFEHRDFLDGDANSSERIGNFNSY